MVAMNEQQTAAALRGFAARVIADKIWADSMLSATEGMIAAFDKKYGPDSAASHVVAAMLEPLKEISTKCQEVLKSHPEVINELMKESGRRN